MGSAGVCVNENSELLMVLQGRPDERKTWSVPTGGKEDNETFLDCCMREVAEETGYQVEIGDALLVKVGRYEELQIAFEVHYFSVKIIGGDQSIQDPDLLIHDVAWTSVDKLADLELTYPEDREFLIDYLKKVN